MVRWRNGNFSLRHLVGTLTANRLIRWPDRDGTIALTNAKTEAIAAETAAGLIKSTGADTASIVATSATIDNLLGAADQAGARVEIGLGSMATQDSSAVNITGGVLTDVRLNRVLLANYQGGEGTLVVADRSLFFDRLAGANKRHTVTPFGGVNLDALFDISPTSAITIPANTTCGFVLDYTNIYPAGVFASESIFYVVPYFGIWGGLQSVTFEVQYAAGGATWTQVAQITSFPGGAVPISAQATAALRSVTALRVTFVVGAATSYVGGLRGIPTEPYEEESGVLFTAGDGPQNFYGPIVFRNSSGSAITRIDPGTLQFNGGATQTASLRGIKTIGTPSTADTITVTGAAVGDIARVSRGKDAYVSAPNTVTFDSEGLAGVAVLAIVERFT